MHVMYDVIVTHHHIITTHLESSQLGATIHSGVKRLLIMSALLSAALRRSLPSRCDVTLSFYRGAATKASNRPPSPQVGAPKTPPDSTIRSDTTATTNNPSEATPIPPPLDDKNNQAHLDAAATTSISNNLQKASSTPTPSSTLSSFSETPTQSNNKINKQSTVSLTAQEFQDKTLLEKLQDLWNERSGTMEILALKESVNEASLEFDQASAKVTFARRHLDDSLREWERTSGQHLQLLQRRESWTAEDAQSFANLVSQEISTRTALEQARNDLATAEETLSKRQLEYMNRMRRRYHEEQIWQDQWRVLGTYGTWSLIVLNSCVFLGSQYFLRLRENARMKAIEELIRENSVQIAAATTRSATKATSSSSTESERSPVETKQVDNENVALVNDGEVEYQDEMLREEEDELVAVEALENASLKERFHHQWQNVRKSAAKNWQSLQSNTKAVLGQVQSKTSDIVRSIPALDEMPKSPSEVHVPSAVVGASITGVVVVVLMALIPPRSK